MVLWRPIRTSRTNTQNRCLFIIGDWNAKAGSQEIPEVTGKFGLGVQNEAGQRIVEFCQENALVIVNTLSQQPKTQLYIWTLPNGQYRNQIDYTPCIQKWSSSVNKTWTWLWLGSWAPYCKNSGLNWRKQGKQAIQSGMTEIESLTITQWKWPLDSRD